MSYVLLLAADRPLPTFETGEVFTFTKGPVSFTKPFAVTPNYYQEVVDSMGLDMKPHQRELYWEVRNPEELACLRGYLRKNLSPGETAEVWALWLGDDTQHVTRHRVPFERFDMEVADILAKGGSSRLKEGVVIPRGEPIPGSACISEQVCVTIEM